MGVRSSPAGPVWKYSIVANAVPSYGKDRWFEPHGTNVNFAKMLKKQLYVRTYEKGVENETLSCGTGVTASAIAASLKYGGNSFYVNTAGGRLFVSFERVENTFKKVKLTGPAKLVFEGTIEI